MKTAYPVPLIRDSLPKFINETNPQSKPDRCEAGTGPAGICQEVPKENYWETTNIYHLGVLATINGP